MTKVCHPKISREMDDDAIFKIILFLWGMNGAYFSRIQKIFVTSEKV
jgi:hypothetical protein